MDQRAERAAAAVEGLWCGLGAVLDGAWLRAEGSAFGLVSGLPMVTVNGVWALGEAADADRVTSLLEQVRQRATDSGVPFCLQARPSADTVAAEVALAAGLQPEADVPLMVLDEPALLPDDGGLLTVEVLPDGEMQRHVEVAARGFDVPVAVFDEVMAALANLPALRAYVGLRDGEPVTTALGVATAGDSLGVFNVATPPEHRGHGYGAAVTAAVVRAGFADGAAWAWLQSSPEGFGVYQRLGFDTVESWRMWSGAG